MRERERGIRCGKVRGDIKRREREVEKRGSKGRNWRETERERVRGENSSAND